MELRPGWQDRLVDAAKQRCVSCDSPIHARAQFLAREDNGPWHQFRKLTCRYCSNDPDSFEVIEELGIEC